MMDRLRNKGVMARKTRYLPNWVELSCITPPKNPDFRRHLGIPGQATVVLFSGTLSRKQGLMVIPEAARLLSSRSDIEFVVCGDGVMKRELESAAAGLRNIRFIPLQPSGRVSDLLGIADIHLLPQSPDAADLVLPSKLCGMLASGRPVIATCRAETEISEIVSQCGLVVAPENGAELAYAITSLADGDDTRMLLGRKARSLAEANFERDAVLSTMFAPAELENERQFGAMRNQPVPP
jgi:colanic acid biosynthesis glycosyl transferase WcaI